MNMIETKEKLFEKMKKMIGTTKKDFPPPLTTSLIKQTGCLQILLTKRCHLVRRCTEDGKRLVVQEVEENDDNKYELRVNRAEGRLIMSIVPMNDNNNNNNKVDEKLCEDIDIDHQNGNYVIQSDHDDDYRSQDDYEINVDADDESSAVEKLGTVSTFASSFDLIGNSY
ncbi:hypothetical protein CsatB_027279 [Cannabis sativa]